MITVVSRALIVISSAIHASRCHTSHCMTLTGPEDWSSRSKLGLCPRHPVGVYMKRHQDRESPKSQPHKLCPKMVVREGLNARYNALSLVLTLKKKKTSGTARLPSDLLCLAAGRSGQKRSSSGGPFSPTGIPRVSHCFSQ